MTKVKIALAVSIPSIRTTDSELFLNVSTYTATSIECTDVDKLIAVIITILCMHSFSNIISYRRIYAEYVFVQ